MAPRKGRLDSILLGDLLASLAESQATGMLTVTNDADTKKVVLDRGQIVIARTGMSEKVMLGDLLIARGLVTEDDVEKALEAQKTQDKRLGELLIELKGLSQQSVDEAVKFQIEEELHDLFTWRKGEFEFNDQVSDADKQAVADKGTAFSIDIRKLVEDANRRIEEWRQHEQRITSPYLVFRPTEKAMAPAVQKELDENALRKRVFKWVQENRTVDTMVCKSCIGRNALYKLLIGWIDERNIELVPVGELKFLASEHRSRHRYYDAMGIYRRLRDAARTDVERRELEGAIADTKLAMEAQVASRRQEAVANQTASLAHVKRAAEMRRSRLIRNTLVYGVGGAVLLGLLAYVVIVFGADNTIVHQRLLEDLDAVIRVQMDSGQADAARAACEKLKSEVPELAEKVDERVQQIDAAHRAAADKKRMAIRSQLGVLDLNDQYARLEELKERYADIPGFAKRIQQDREDLAREAKIRQELLRQNSLSKWRLVGAVRQEQGDFGQARRAYGRALGMCPENGAERAELNRQLAAMAAVEESQRQALQAACELDRKGENLAAVLTQYQAVAALQPRLAWGDMAQDRATVLQAELAAAARLVETTRGAASGPDVDAAETKLRLAVIRLAPFGDLANDLKAELNTLVTRRLQVETEIQEAVNLDKQNRTDQARLKYADLLQRYRSELVRRKLTLPWLVASNPTGAEVVVGDEVVGLTPLAFRLAADDNRPIKVRKGGFAAHELDPAERRRLQADVTLYVEPVWTIRLTQGICGGLAFTERDLFILNGGQLQCVRPSTKTAVFDPVELLKLPVGGRKREAVSFSGELKPPEWWALQFPPVVTGKSEYAWLTVNDCRLARVNLLDQSVESVRCAIEAGTPLTPFTNPFVRNSEVALFVGLDEQLYEADLTDLTKTPQPLTTLKYKPLPVRLAGTDLAIAVSAAGELVRLPIGDYDNTKAYPMTQPIGGPMYVVSKADNLGNVTHRALAVAEDGSLELIDLGDMSRVWLQPASTFAVRTLTLLDDGASFLQTGITGGKSVCELQPIEGGGQGRPTWSITLEGNPVRPCASKNTVYVATDDKNIHAYRRSDGQLLWQSPIPGLPERIEAHADGTVAVVVKQDDQRSVMIYKVETGE